MSDASIIPKLGRYELLRVLGAGAMGVVYEGFDPLLKRRVAVKTILRSALVDPETIADSSARFVREAQAVARLNHPHIVTVFDFGEHGDVVYFVMEFIRGRDLKSYFAGARFEIGESLRIIGELLAALEFAHQNGVVHRDVKPANIMLDDGRRVKLTDFGVARLADAAADRTKTGTMVGTPSYMSPEQIQGLAVGSRTDLFAVGIILYECLTGVKPFAGPGVWTVQKQIVHDNPSPPSVTNPEIDPRFDAIVARALAKDPADRYATAAEFDGDLAAVFRSMRSAETSVRMEGAARATAAPINAVAEASLSAAARPVSVSLEPTVVPLPAATLSSLPEVAGADRTSIAGRTWLIAGLIALFIAGGAWYALTSRSPAPLGSASASGRAPSPNPVPTAPGLSETAAPLPTAVSPLSVPTGEAHLDWPPVKELVKPPNKRRERFAMPDTTPTKAVDARVVPAGGTTTGNPRCQHLLQRFQLGDDLSADDVQTLKTECGK